MPKVKNVPEFVVNSQSQAFILKQVKNGKAFFEKYSIEEKLNLIKELSSITKSKKVTGEAKAMYKLLYYYICLDLQDKITERKEFFKKF